MTLIAKEQKYPNEAQINLGTSKPMVMFRLTILQVKCIITSYHAEAFPKSSYTLLTVYNKMIRWLYLKKTVYIYIHVNLCVMVTCLIVLFLLQTLSFQCVSPVESAFGPIHTAPSLVRVENKSRPFTENRRQ